ncbi:MAG: hypothetical protein AAFQ66_00245 [Pseudomonadota bacterium]
MREPTAWLYSWYRFRARSDLRSVRTAEARNSTGGISFPDFVRAYLSPRPPAYADPGGTQFDFVRNSEGQNGVDWIVPYEQVDLLVTHLSRTLGVPLHLPVTNVSPKAMYRSSRIQWAADIVQRAKLQLGFDARSGASESPDLHLPSDITAALRRKLADDFRTFGRAQEAVSGPRTVAVHAAE